jgi:hypothetical protein
MHRRRRRPRSAHPDLFAPRLPTPTWDHLPPPVRQRVVTLLAELLGGRHVLALLPGRRKEAAND